MFTESWKSQELSAAEGNSKRCLHKSHQSFQSLTFLAKGSEQGPTKHKQMLAWNANTFRQKNSTQACLELLKTPLRMTEKEMDFWARLWR